MPRTQGSRSDLTGPRVRAAALRLFARHGYAAVSMRQIAGEVGVQAGALYSYTPDKQSLLFSLMQGHMEELLAATAALQASGPPEARLEAFTRHHIRFHVERRHSTHVNNMELRSLSREKLSHVLRLRSTYEKELRQILREGQETGSLIVDDPALTAMAIIQMITGVIVWFRPDERLSVDEVAEKYLSMTMRLVGADDKPREKTGVHAIDEFRAW